MNILKCMLYIFTFIFVLPNFYGYKFSRNLINYIDKYEGIENYLERFKRKSSKKKKKGEDENDVSTMDDSKNITKDGFKNKNNTDNIKNPDYVDDSDEMTSTDFNGNGRNKNSNNFINNPDFMDPNMDQTGGYGNNMPMGNNMAMGHGMYGMHGIGMSSGMYGIGMMDYGMGGMHGMNGMYGMGGIGLMSGLQSMSGPLMGMLGTMMMPSPMMPGMYGGMMANMGGNMMMNNRGSYGGSIDFDNYDDDSNNSLSRQSGGRIRHSKHSNTKADDGDKKENDEDGNNSHANENHDNKGTKSSIKKKENNKPTHDKSKDINCQKTSNCHPSYKHRGGILRRGPHNRVFPRFVPRRRYQFG